MPVSSSEVGEGRGRSPEENADVGEGKTSFKRLPDVDAKLLVLHEKADVAGRDSYSAGGLSAKEVEGREFLRVD
jgi:hypothetical protein